MESIHDGLKGDAACLVRTCLHIARSSSSSNNSSSSCSSSSINRSSPSAHVSQEQAAPRKASLLCGPLTLRFNARQKRCRVPFQSQTEQRWKEKPEQVARGTTRCKNFSSQPTNCLTCSFAAPDFLKNSAFKMSSAVSYAGEDGGKKNTHCSDSGPPRIRSGRRTRTCPAAGCSGRRCGTAPGRTGGPGTWPRCWSAGRTPL